MMFFFSEVTDINEQKFLTELGKLLTFMYEEDRQNALALYSRMFDKAVDEMALMQLLGSPTRQAVIVARAYNAREHKLDVYSRARETSVSLSSGEMPDYVRAINEIHQAAVSQNIIEADVASGQFTLFSDDDAELTEQYSYEGAYDAASAYAPAEPAPLWEEAPAAPVQEAEPAAPVAAPVQNEPVSDPATDPSVYAAPVVVPAEIVPAEEAAPAVYTPEPVPDTPIAAEASVPEGPEVPQQDEAEEPVVIVLPEEDDQPLAESLPLAESAEPAEPVEAAEPSDVDMDVSQPEPEPIPELTDEDEQEDEDEEVLAPEESEEPVRKPRTFLLILYILVAIPVTLLCTALLLIPTLFFLGLAVSVIAAGSMTLIAAFSGFAVLADIMVVLGLALIILALGLLFLWIFIWFIGGAITGLVRGVFALGSKWCYKEVPAV